MPRKTKCKACLQFDDKELMIKEKEGYFHIGTCHNKYKDHKRFLEREKVEWNELFETVKKINNLAVIPSRFIADLQRIRNGNQDSLYRNNIHYKKGIPYRVIKEAYERAERDIQWSIQNKQFTNTYNQLKYGLAIVVEKINDVVNELRRKKKAEQKQEMVHDFQSVLIEEVKYINNQQDDNDISQFLD
jgi:hypothetical protein